MNEHMKRVFSLLKVSLIVISFLWISSCENYFEYSPYAANVNDSYKNTSKTEMNYLLEADTVYRVEFKFAVIADSHYNFNELHDAIKNINKNKSLDFVIVNGDIADHGYLKEYELFHENMEDLSIPYLTVIGNHDYRSNGKKIYNKMYGEVNKRFTFNNNLFILFDDVFWESNKNPDMDWLEKELKDNDKYENVFVLSHIPPYSRQFTDEFEMRYRELMLKYEVDLSIHGHIHRHDYSDYYNDGMLYLGVETIMDKEYVILTVKDNNINVERIKY